MPYRPVARPRTGECPGGRVIALIVDAYHHAGRAGRASRHALGELAGAPNRLVSRSMWAAGSAFARTRWPALCR